MRGYVLVSKPISTRLLIHKATHEYGGLVIDDWGNETHAKTQNLSRIRMEPVSKLASNKDNNEVQLSILMFFDTRNSYPKDAIFELGDVVRFKGIPYTITSIDALYDDRKLHHYEIGLV